MKTYWCRLCGEPATTDDGRSPDGWYAIHETVGRRKRLVGRVCSVRCAEDLLGRIVLRPREPSED